MKTYVVYAIILLTFIAAIGMFLHPKVDSEVESQIKSLAYSHHLYISEVCPNQSSTNELRTKYLKTIPQNQVSKRDFVNEHFSDLFLEECIKHEVNK
ncbi:hypothetical protein Ac42p139 [Acinetobacter phage Ac42]|uniref:hypothetical protein n=1 Tax=Acinetobacter phage Ac42 TaxID=762660 RepID=UPI0001EBCD62|nr:hypothetical protein Ac42p139 [Acinetobacter phage Ac42]ADI96377.1 hypothetical protein Ac42p139 [Acinetobacter phage Ac42]